MASNPTLRIGVLLVDTVQLLDLSSIDILGMLSRTSLSVKFLPDALKAGTIPMEIHYINEAGPAQLHDCTARVALRIDYAISDSKIAPPKKGAERTLDVLLIPGPDPSSYKQTDAMSDFIKGHFESGTDVLCVCTGVYAAGYAGILKGKKAMGPRSLVSGLKEKFPEAQWQDKRWTSDGNLWSSDGITNGQDMVAAYIRAKWPGPTAEAIISMADVGDRAQEHSSKPVQY